MPEIELQEKGLWRELLILATPITLHNLIQSLVGVVDVIMVGQINNESLATVGVANQVFFMVCVAIFGIASGGAVFMSRAWGSRDIPQLQKITGISLLVCLAMTIPLGITSYFNSYDILYFFSTNSFLSTYGQRYVEITSVSFLCTAFTIVLAVQLRCVGKGHLPMIAAGISLLVNALLNYLLIFGNWHFPAWGLDGAAVATLSARMLETLITCFFFIKFNPAYSKIAHCFSFVTAEKKELHAVLTSFLHVAFPIMLIELLWAIGQGVYKLIFGRMGVPQLAAYTVLETLINLFSAAAIGFANAAGVLMGYKLGVPDLPKARAYASYFIRTNFIFTLPISLILFCIAGYLPSLFSMNPQESIILRNGLYVCAVFLSLKSYNFLMTTGIFRVGGDGRYASIVSAISFIGFGIPVSLIGGLAFHWPFLAILLVIFIEENIRNILLWQRYHTGKWLHEILKL